MVAGIRRAGGLLSPPSGTVCRGPARSSDRSGSALRPRAHDVSEDNDQPRWMVDDDTGCRSDHVRALPRGRCGGACGHSLEQWASHAASRRHGHSQRRASRLCRRGSDSLCRCTPSSLTASEHDRRPDRMNRVRPSSPPLVTLRELYGTNVVHTTIWLLVPFDVSFESTQHEHHRGDTASCLADRDQQR